MEEGKGGTADASRAGRALFCAAASGCSLHRSLGAAGGVGRHWPTGLADGQVWRLPSSANGRRGGDNIVGWCACLRGRHSRCSTGCTHRSEIAQSSKARVLCALGLCLLRPCPRRRGRPWSQDAYFSQWCWGWGLVLGGPELCFPAMSRWGTSAGGAGCTTRRAEIPLPVCARVFFSRPGWVGIPLEAPVAAPGAVVAGRGAPRRVSSNSRSTAGERERGREAESQRDSETERQRDREKGKNKRGRQAEQRRRLTK